MEEESTSAAAARLIGRLLIGGVFIVNGAGLIGAFREVTGLMASKGVSAASPPLVLTILAWLTGGASILVGYRSRVAASLLALMMVPVTLFIHAPWNADVASFRNELNHFMSKVALIGGLQCLAASAPGRFAIGARR